MRKEWNSKSFEQEYISSFPKPGRYPSIDRYLVSFTRIPQARLAAVKDPIYVQ